MHRLTSSGGVTVSYERSGQGPPLVLVHGSFGDHHANWQFVKSILEDRFTLYAIARRGRGATDATNGHSLEDEAQDVVSVVEAVSTPVFLLGHSYGAQCALAAADMARDRVRKLVLYEAPWPGLNTAATLARLEQLAKEDAWDDVAFTFFRESIHVPLPDLEALRRTELWPPIVTDAKASLGDMRALSRHTFTPGRYGRLALPVLLQIGSESRRSLYVTDALASVLPDARIETLPGQAHEGMTTAPEMWAAAVTRFLLD